METKDQLIIFIPSDERITEDGYIKFSEKLIKQGGERWVFHKNDPDPFPSQSHGHNNETKEKLDINTGIIYSIITKNAVRKLSRKQLMLLTKKLKESNFI